jgi:tRNA A-37 threonylcarbamoyl transferase component Bud32
LKTSPRRQPDWLVNAEYRETLSPAVLNRLINREGVRHALTQRELSSRTVTLLKTALPELPALYLKEYRFTTFAQRLKSLFGSPAHREWHTALRIIERGISTFTPLAVGTLRRFGLPVASYLVSREVDHARPLKGYLLHREHHDDQSGWEAGKAVTCSLARFVRDLHRRGILHGDFHWGNILIDARDLSDIRWYLMDLHRIQLKRRLRDRDRIANLASLGTAFRCNSRKSERLRFLMQYARGDERWKKQLGYFARRIESRSAEMLQHIWNRKVRRCTKGNKHFTSFSSPACRGLLSRACSSPELMKLLQDPGQAFSAPGRRMIKNSNTTSSCILPIMIAGDTAGIFIKRFNYQSALYALKYLVRTSRGQRAWKAAHALLARGVPTPEPVAYGEKRRRRMLRESFFVTRALAHAIPVSALFPGAGRRARDGRPVDRADLVRRAARLVRTMHERGIWHRDLKAGNILAEPMPGGGMQLYLADLDGIRVKDTVRRAERIRDLARLNRSLITSPALSARDRHCFLQCYLGAANRGDATLRAYWEEIRKETAKKLAKVKKNL